MFGTPEQAKAIAKMEKNGWAFSDWIEGFGGTLRSGDMHAVLTKRTDVHTTLYSEINPKGVVN